MRRIRSDRDNLAPRQKQAAPSDSWCMELDAKLDLNVVAVDSGETVHLLLELEAPGLKGERRRDPANLQVVLDRSGSMGGGSLTSALQAIDSLIGRLRPDDQLGLVMFDDTVMVPIPAGPVGNGARAKDALRQIYPGGMTNLSSGLMRGIQEASRGAGDGSSTLVLLSDGHANQGTTEHAALEGVARGAAERRITVSSIGIGLGYDEDLLESISRGGGGNSHFAENGDEAGACLAGEVDGLLEQVIQAASLVVRPSGDVSSVRLFNDLPVSQVNDGFMVELGEMVSEEKRKLLFEIDVPDIAALGLAQVCELELHWVETETMEGKTVTLPVNVNVVPGDQAAGRIADPEVKTELTFQVAQRAKKEASDALARGDHDGARRLWEEARINLQSVDRGSLEGRQLQEIDEEMAMIDRIELSSDLDIRQARKISQADYHRKNRKRGREDRRDRR